jgi:ferredoxin
MLLRLKFDSKAVKKPVISSVTLKTSALINIIKAEVGPRKGELIVEVEDYVVENVEKALKELGVSVCRLKKIERSDACVHCGACISICPVEAIEMMEDGRVEFMDKCVLCGNCVKVCPVNALSVPI